MPLTSDNAEPWCRPASPCDASRRELGHPVGIPPGHSEGAASSWRQNRDHVRVGCHGPARITSSTAATGPHRGRVSAPGWLPIRLRRRGQTGRSSRHPSSISLLTGQSRRVCRSSAHDSVTSGPQPRDVGGPELRTGSRRRQDPGPRRCAAVLRQSSLAWPPGHARLRPT